jgi:hypothetical protein
MLSIAYKSVVNSRRSTARMISGLEARESDEGKKSKIKEYRTKVSRTITWFLQKESEAVVIGGSTRRRIKFSRVILLVFPG